MLMKKTKNNLFYLLLDLWSHFRRRRKIQFFGLLLLSIITAFAEILSLGAVLPFLGALTDPNTLFDAPFMQTFLRVFSITTPQEMLFPLTLVFIGSAIIAGITRLLQLWANTRVSFSTGAELSVEVYRRTLYQSYSVHVTRNSSAIINAVSTKIPLVTNGTIVPVISLISSGFILVSIVSTLLYINPVISLLAFAGFSFTYLLIIMITRSPLKNNGVTIAEKSTLMVKTMQEGLGGIRDVLIDGAQKLYYQTHAKAVLPLRRAQAINQFIGQSPRFVIEAIAIALIGGLSYWLMGQPGSLSNNIPILGTLVFGAQRMLPSLQLIYVSWAQLQSNTAVVSDVLEFLKQPVRKERYKENSDALSFRSDITLKNVHFRYISSGSEILTDINIVIKKGTKIGFIGETGSGKSTLLDIIMGLLEPSAGELLVDGKIINKTNQFAWQKSIAHVPQNIFLSDSSIEENIAFGTPVEKIDHKRVQWAAQQAQIHKLIKSWSEQYQTFVGERGVRLSGGQLQRIGIARALYKRAGIIVFDEATSSLDMQTEEKMMKTIDGLDKELTIMIITHRLTTLKNCDLVIELENGNIKRIVDYNELVGDSIIDSFSE